MTSGSAPRSRRLSAGQRRALIEQAATELFAERAYAGTSMDEIARRSGVSVPVVYDHFSSKQQLYRQLLERHFAELREVWATHLDAALSADEQLSAAIDAWFDYLHRHPFAWRNLFRDTTGAPDIQALHDDIVAHSRDALLPLLRVQLSATTAETPLIWEVIRAVLQGLAMWWLRHPDTPRQQLVSTAMNTLWMGLDRYRDGQRWDNQPKPTST